MRIENSIKNIYVSLISQLIIILLGFISRKVFIDSLGAEYLGVNGLLTNILSMLSLVEGGMGASIIYNLYKPLANNDISTVTSLVQLYKKIYSFLAIIIFILGIIMYPFLGIFLKEQDNIPFLGIVYFIFILKNMVSYFNAHKWSLITADQKGYVLTGYNLLFNIITTITKIIILLYTSNYILYLLIELIIFIIQNIWNGHIVNKRYPYIKVKEKYELHNEIKSNIIVNVKSIFLHNIGSYCVFSTDNLLISALINTKTVGLYSNYTMILTYTQAFLNQFTGGVGASIGHLIATENTEKGYTIYRTFYLINFWIYSLATISLYNVVEPFIDVWLGDGLLLSHGTFIVILINFYLTGMRNPINLFKEKSGIFAPDRYLPLIEAVINLVASLILTNWFGLVGIFLGTTVSTLLIPFWTQPKIVFKCVFERSIIEYFKTYFYYVSITIISGLLSAYICNLIPYDGFLLVLVRGLISVGICSICYLLLFYRSEEFKYIISIFKPRISKLVRERKQVI